MVYQAQKSLINQAFKPSDINSYLYVGNGIIVLTYVDNCIIVRPSMPDIYSFVESMQNGAENFILDNKGDIDKFLGIEIT